MAGRRHERGENNSKEIFMIRTSVARCFCSLSCHTFAFTGRGVSCGVVVVVTYTGFACLLSSQIGLSHHVAASLSEQ